MIKEFDKFINEKYTLTIEDSMDDFESAPTEVEWVDNFDVSDIWNQYKGKKITDQQFIGEYNKKLIEKKENFTKIGTDCWNDLVKLLNKKDKEFHTYLNEVYDWADKYGVKIISENKKEEK